MNQETILKAIKDYQTALKVFEKMRYEEFYSYLEQKWMDYGLCRYFYYVHGINDISDIAPKGKYICVKWWKFPSDYWIKDKPIIHAIKVRLKFLKTLIHPENS